MDFDDAIKDAKGKFKPISLALDKVKRISKFSEDIAIQKLSESHHKEDNFHERTRFYTGTLAEGALEDFLGVDIIDWSIGDSVKYNRPDLGRIGINAGIKGVEFGKLPIVHKNSKSPEVICIICDARTVWICGVADSDVLNTFQDDSLILDPSLRKRGTKTAFYGFDKLVQFNNIEELKVIVRQLNEKKSA